jgi:uncharacterized membrane protein YczE
MSTFNVKETLFYLLGTVTIAFGVVMVIKSGLGTGPWDTVFIVLARRIDPLTIGVSAIIVTSLLTVLTALIRKNLTLLLMIIPILFVGTFIDLFDLVIFADFNPAGIVRFVPYITGLFMVPLGGAMLVVTRYPAGVFEEMSLLVRDLLHFKNVFPARMLIETFPVLLSGTLALIWFSDFGAINVGTLGFIVFIGPLFQLYLIRLEPLKF